MNSEVFFIASLSANPATKFAHVIDPDCQKSCDKAYATLTRDLLHHC